jgi:hypothetical protein
LVGLAEKRDSEDENPDADAENTEPWESRIYENDFVQTPLGQGRFLRRDPLGYLVCSVNGTSIGSEYTFDPKQVRSLGGYRNLNDPIGLNARSRTISEAERLRDVKYGLGKCECEQSSHEESCRWCRSSGGKGSSLISSEFIVNSR